MIRIFLLGATDRFNYGDLLFPIILKHKIEELNSEKIIDVKNYAIIKSNFSRFGALPTSSIKELYEDCKLTSIPVCLIIVGGEVLSAQWGGIYSFLKRGFKYYHDFNRFVLRKFYGITVNPIAKFKLQGRTQYPFIVTKNNFPNVKLVIYNSVGGMRGKISTARYKVMKKAFLNSDYNSFRDRATFNRMNPLCNNAKLAPDSAVLMSTIYSKEYLCEEFFGFKFKSEEYVFFQISKRDLRLIGIDSVVRKLKTIIEQREKRIILCPIGTALGHEDHKALLLIFNLLENYKEKVLHVKNPSIFEIMSLIANSSLYIGSSLHGVITAMSYSIPYLAIRNSSKIISYLDTWAVKPLNKLTDLKNWDNQLELAFKINKSKLVNNRNNQIELASASINEIFQKILLCK